MARAAEKITVRLGDAEVDLTNLRVRGAHGEVPLTSQEAALLQFLAEHRGVTVSRERLLTQVWGQAKASSCTRAVDNAVLRLRKKIEADPGRPDWLVATRGGGYRLEPDPAETARPLPTEPDAFVGRERELAAIDALLDDGTVLLTLTGAGGIGKSRLALRCATRRATAYAGGVFFCDLTESTSAADVVVAAGHALELQLGSDPRTQIGTALAAAGPCLVVLDHFESVVVHAAETVGRWRTAAPDARFLVACRERLGLPGEVVLDVPPLDAPSAFDLFVARARTVAHDFSPVEQDREAIVELVALLDHLPLAVELAASRMQVMTPAMALDRLSDRFRLLSAPGRMGRHATLRATLGSSWELLGVDERRALAALTVFERGFTLAAAEGVLDAPDTLDVLQRLVEKSLVRRVALDRFDLLVSVKEFAREHLDDPQEVETRHGRWFAETWDQDGIYAAMSRWPVARWRLLAAERDNLCAASRRAVLRGDAATAGRTSRAAGRVFERTGPASTSAALAEGALSVPGDDLKLRITLHLQASSGHRLDNRYADAEAHLTHAQALAGELDAAVLVARIHNDRGVLRLDQARLVEARAALELAVATFRLAGDLAGEAMALANAGGVSLYLGDWDRAEAELSAALRLARDIGARAREGTALMNIGLLQQQRGDIAAARRTFAAACEVWHELGNERAMLRMQAATYQLVDENASDEALELLQRCIHLARKLGARKAEANYHLNHGLLLVHTLGRPEQARQVFEEALALSRASANDRLYGASLAALGDLDRRSGDLATARTRLAEADAVLHRVEDRIELARLLCYRVELCRASGDLAGADAMLAEIEAAADALGAGPASGLRTWLDRLRAPTQAR